LNQYEGLAALVTGASSGIGRLLALRLAARGARVALVARRADRLEAVADEIRRQGSGEALVLTCDVGDADQIGEASARVLEHYGAIDLLVNNAGYGGHRTFLEWDAADIERMTRVNYLSAVHFTKALLPAMIRRRRGWLVFVASVVGHVAVAGESAYVGTKFAMVGLAETISLEVEDAGVHVLTVCPGAIRTPFFSAEDLERMPGAVRRSMVEPEPLVEAILGALARGKRRLTFPRYMALAYAVRALAPGFLRRQVKGRTTALREPGDGS